jgi:hypothetical protein
MNRHFLTQGTRSAVKRVDIIVLNAYAPTEDKSHDTKNSLYEELERAFDQFPLHCINILLDFNADVLERRYFQTNNRE